MRGKNYLKDKKKVRSQGDVGAFACGELFEYHEPILHVCEKVRKKESSNLLLVGNCSNTTNLFYTSARR